MVDIEFKKGFFFGAKTHKIVVGLYKWNCKDTKNNFEKDMPA